MRPEQTTVIPTVMNNSSLPVRAFISLIRSSHWNQLFPGVLSVLWTWTYKGGVWISLMSFLGITANKSFFFYKTVFSVIIFPNRHYHHTRFWFDQNCHCEMFGLGLVLQEVQRNVSVTSKYSNPLIQLFPLKIFLWTFSWIGTPAVNIFVSLLEWTPAIWSLWSPYLAQCSSPRAFPFLPPHPRTTSLHSFCFNSTASHGLLGPWE